MLMIQKKTSTREGRELATDLATERNVSWFCCFSLKLIRLLYTTKAIYQAPVVVIYGSAGDALGSLDVPVAVEGGGHVTQKVLLVFQDGHRGYLSGVAIVASSL